MKNEALRSNKMTLIHCSPGKIEKIKKDYGSGIFEDVLFFATTAYSLGPSDYEYHVEVEESEIIRARELEEYYESKEFKDEQRGLCRVYDFLNEDDAYDLISAYKTAYDFEADSEELANLSWTIQKIQAQLARAFGFRFCESRDGQGIVYAGAMFGRENELVLFEEEE